MPAHALSVSPTRIEVPGGAAQATLILKSENGDQTDIQIRVFGWKEGTSPDRLTNTRDVAVSPPMSRIRGRQELTIRIVRLKAAPVRGRECYRVLVDQLPAAAQPGSRISMRIRHSVPLCFSS